MGDDRFCYDGCAKMDPGLFSDQAAFVFIPFQEEYTLRAVFVGEYDQDYWDPFGEETILPCDPRSSLFQHASSSLQRLAANAA